MVFGHRTTLGNAVPPAAGTERLQRFAVPALMRVLFIDSQPIVRRALRDLLQTTLQADGRGECEATEVGALEEALALLKESRWYDLIITELVLPDAQGTESVRRLVDALPDGRIFVVSSEVRTATMFDAIQRGAAGFVAKCSALSVFRVALRTVLEGGIYCPPGVEIPAPVAPRIAHRIHAGNAEPVGSLRLSPKQSRIAALAARGESNKAIARVVHVSEDTVKYHLRNVYAQLGVSGRETLRSVLGE